MCFSSILRYYGACAFCSAVGIKSTTAVAAIPLKTRFPRSLPWWTPALTRLKNECRRIRRHYQQARTPHRRDLLLGRWYRSLRRRYTRNVARAKLTSLRHFVYVRGNAEAFGLVYNVLRRKLSPEEVFTHLPTPATQAST